MGRPKHRCKGITSSGSSCKNWASKGSFYCHLHQGQETAEDRKIQQKGQNIGTVLMVVIIVVGFLVSMATGCEKEFADWATR